MTPVFDDLTLLSSGKNTFLLPIIRMLDDLPVYDCLALCFEWKRGLRLVPAKNASQASLMFLVTIWKLELSLASRNGYSFFKAGSRLLRSNSVNNFDFLLFL